MPPSRAGTDATRPGLRTLPTLPTPSVACEESDRPRETPAARQVQDRALVDGLFVDDRGPADRPVRSGTSAPLQPFKSNVATRSTSGGPVGDPDGAGAVDRPAIEVEMKLRRVAAADRGAQGVVGGERMRLPSRWRGNGVSLPSSGRSWSSTMPARTSACATSARGRRRCRRAESPSPCRALGGGPFVFLSSGGGSLVTSRNIVQNRCMRRLKTTGTR